VPFEVGNQVLISNHRKPAGANAGRLFDGFEETKKGCQLEAR